MSDSILNTIGNVIGVIAISYKCHSELIGNPRYYGNAIKSGTNPLDAAREKRSRSDVATANAFMGLLFSYVFLLIGGIISG